MKFREHFEKQTNDINDIKVCLVRQEQNLKHHVKRTTLLEENVKLLRREFSPIKMHIAVVNGITKAFLGLLAATGTLAGIYHVFFM